MPLIIPLLMLANGLDIQAGKYNPVLSPGDQAPLFSNLPGVDGKKHSISDFEKAKVKVLAFTCNDCPYAQDYEDRLNAFHEKFCKNEQVVLIAINSNLVPADSMEKMKERAQVKEFGFLYLLDQSQQLARKMGALRTPEFYVLDSENRIVYMGAFDDNTKNDLVKQKYVEQAVQSILDGKEVATKQTPPIGCLIRFKRSRRRR